MSGPLDPRGAVQGPAAGAGASVLRARRASRSCSRAARATIAARSRASTASRSPICRPPRSPRSWRKGAAHLGVTGEDLVREMIPQADSRVVLLDARSVSATPMSWSRCRRPGSTCARMADLDDVATAFRLRHDRKMRVATKYVNLTRAFFAAPRHRRLPHRRKPRRDRRRAGCRHRRADRRHHHHRRDACRQRPQGDRRRRDAALAGEPRRGAARAAGTTGARESARAHSRPHRGAGSRASFPRGAHALFRMRRRAARRRRGSASASWRRSAGRPRPAC